MPSHLVRVELIEEVWIEAENEEEACAIAESEARDHIDSEIIATDNLR